MRCDKNHRGRVQGPEFSPDVSEQENSEVTPTILRRENLWLWWRPRCCTLSGCSQRVSAGARLSCRQVFNNKLPARYLPSAPNVFTALLQVWIRYPSLNRFTGALVSVAAIRSGLQLRSLHTVRSVQAETTACWMCRFAASCCFSCVKFTHNFLEKSGQHLQD